ncbi:MAG: nitroreductase family protein [Muricomes sp.]
MVLFNQELCTGCGACVKDCPGGVIQIAAGKAENKGPCIQCGHCVAICPASAVSIPEYDMWDVEEYDAETFRVKPENLLHAIKFRRSIRNFKPKKIEEEKIKHLLDAGRYTATAKNEQASTFIFVQDKMEEFRSLLWETMPEILETIKKEAPLYARVFGVFYERWKADSKNDTFLFNAPAFLAISTENHPLDGGLVAANIENMAVAEGLGVLFSGYMERVVNASPKLKEWLGVGEKEVVCCMLAGYPAVTYKRTAPRREGNIIRK